MAKTTSGNPKGSSPPTSSSAKNLGFTGPYMTEEDKKANEAILQQIEYFKKMERFYSPLALKIHHYVQLLKEYIIGQDEGIEKLVYIVYNNLHQNMMADYHDMPSKRLSAIVVGPSGCGKTATLTKLAELFNVPFLKYNATPLTSGGFVGKDVEAMLKKLIEVAKGDITLAQRGILYIDEIDKKVSSAPNNTSGRDINGTAVQEELLKFLEPSLIDLGKDGLFDVSQLTVLMSGRFIDLNKKKEKRLRGASIIGFASSSEQPLQEIFEDSEEDDFNEFDDSLSPEFTHQDIINFGFIDEFVGRVFDVIEFKPLSKDDLIDIIFAKGSVLQNFVEMIHTKGQELIVDMAIYDRMAEAAMASPMGARKLESIVNKFLIPANTDFMEHYRPGIMEYDYDGNYSSVFQNKDGSLSYKFIEGPRAKRRKNHSENSILVSSG